MQPLFAVFQKNPLTGAAIAAFPAVAVVATLVMLQQPAHAPGHGLSGGGGGVPDRGRW